MDNPYLFTYYCVKQHAYFMQLYWCWRKRNDTKKSKMRYLVLVLDIRIRENYLLLSNRSDNQGQFHTKQMSSYIGNESQLEHQINSKPRKEVVWKLKITSLIVTKNDKDRKIRPSDYNQWFGRGGKKGKVKKEEERSALRYPSKHGGINIQVELLYFSLNMHLGIFKH